MQKNILFQYQKTQSTWKFEVTGTQKGLQMLLSCSENTLILLNNSQRDADNTAREDHKASLARQQKDVP